MVDTQSSPKIRHDWYQNEESVTVSVFIKNVKADQLKLEMSERAVSIDVKLPTGSSVIFDLDPLTHAIDVQASKYEILGSQIQLVLAKQQTGLQWEKLEGEDDSIPTVISAVSHDYPSSSIKGKKNWDSITAAELTEKDESNPDDFLKTLFKDADPDTKKAMMKSYSESGGTALSTNWGEVSKKKTDILPPDGMVAKKYE